MGELYFDRRSVLHGAFSRAWRSGRRCGSRKSPAKAAAGEHSGARAARDWCWETAEFLDQGPSAAHAHKLTEFVTETKFTKDPGDLVFREDPSKIYDASGKSITDW